MKRMKLNITFDILTLRQGFVTATITKCVEEVLQMESVPIPCEINILVTNDKGIRAINKASRNIDSSTDVLSFPMFDFTPGQLPENWDDYLDPETGMCPLGDMAISLERAIAQAKEFGHSTRREVGYLTIHSILHLLGYDHMDEGEQKAQMRMREEEIASGIRGIQRNVTNI